MSVGVPLRLLVLVALLLGARPGAAEEEHPLQPPDTTSPRATLTTFLRSFDRAWELFSSQDPRWRDAFRASLQCLDLSEVPPSVREGVAADATLLIKEVLDRLPPAPPEQIPGPRDVAEGVVQWTVPHTEIVIARVSEGDRAGRFLFTPGTVARAREFYDRVRHLPLQPGREGAHYDELRFGGLSPGLSRLAARLPAVARREVGGALAWQWGGVLLALLLSAAALSLFARLGRSWTRWEEAKKGGRRFGPFLAPLALIAAALASRAAAFELVRLAGVPFFVLHLVLTAVAHLGVGWLLAVALARLGELVLRFFRAPEHLRTAQLVRVSSRILTIVAVTVYLFLAAQSLGLPVPALIAGLGVGGLAVALATQGTLENLIAGFILHADQPVRVGDVVRMEGRIGVVREIGLRSARIRTIDRSVLSIPNADLARRELENLSLQDRLPIRTRMHLGPETTAAQLGKLLASIDRSLSEESRLVPGEGGARLVGFGEFSIEVEIKAFAATTDWAELLKIRQDVLLRALECVEQAGAKLARPR